MQGEENYLGAGHEATEDDSRSAVNKLILDYYKKFGRKRDLEHYFSLSTAQNDLRDPSGSFWRRMKSQDSSDCSGDKSESSQELCRISITCSQADPSDSQYEHSKKGCNSESPAKSPPIIVEDPVEDVSKNSDDDYGKSDDNQSQKSLDMLDTSTNPRSPTSSITSQRKLEWDSLADVGYANESDRKNSASSLSTLERLALKQQYTNNDAEKCSQLGLPTAHSTPLDENDRSKPKKGLGSKTKIYKKDVDFVDVNVPQNNNGNASQLINVNLTKHISINVQKDGGVTMDNITTDVNIEKSPEKVSVETEITPQIRIDKEIQTTIKTNDKSVNPDIPKKLIQPRKPVMIRLNTLKKRNRRKKIKNIRKKINTKKKSMIKSNVQDKAGEQLSEAESFEYMPGHVYNQNHMNINQSKSVSAGNKSSLESSGLPTSDSSKGSKYSFKKDLEKSIDILKAALQENYDNKKIKKKLIKNVILRLLNSKYRDDESSTDFLSGLSFKSNRIALQESNQTTSTSEGNTFDKIKTRPKKSILRTEKFNANDLAPTSQSAPNLPIATNNDEPFASNFVKHSNTDTDASSREKLSSNGFAKTSSEQIYQKYLEALKKEETYKRLLRDKEILLKQKLRSSDSAFKVPFQLENKVNNRMSELLKDLTRNNYNDGSGDASKLEGVGGASNLGFEFNRRCHSVFTLSSGHSDQNKKQNQKKRQQTDVKDLNKIGPSKREHYCCCPHHNLSVKGVMDSSVQVNIENKPIIDEKHFYSQKPSTKPGKNIAHFVSDVATGEVKYVCLCGDTVSEKVPDKYLIYRCSRLENKGVQSDDVSPETVVRKHDDEILRDKNVHHIYQACTSGGINKSTFSTESSGSDIIPLKRPSKSSQTNLFLKMLCRKSSGHSTVANSLKDISKIKENHKKKVVHEAIRCIQTEISIDPKISDPSLTDINIINDMDCFKLVSEQYRVVSSRNSETDTRNQEVQSDVEASTSDENINQTNSKDIIRSEVKLLESQSEIENKNKNSVISLTTDAFPENFTIPIQGTNMMLMVSIGNNIQASEPKQVVTQGIAMENPEKAEESTSLMEECSKAVQNDLIRDMEYKSASIDHNSNRISPKEDINPNFVDPSVKPIKKFSTYPKYMKKNFLRSNTDTDIVHSVSLQNDLVKDNTFQKQYKNLDMQPPKKNVEKSSKQINISESSDRSCPNDCYLNNENCTGSCGYCPSKSEEMPTKYDIPNRYDKSIDTVKTSDDKNMYLEPRSEKNVSSKKDVGIQKYMSLERNFEEIDIPKENDDYSNNSKYTVNSKKTENNTNKEYKKLPDNITNNHIETNINVPKASDLLSNYKSSENIKRDINEFKRKQSNVINTETKIQEGINTNYHNLVPTLDKDLERNDLNIESSEETLSNIYAQDPILNIIKDITKRYSKTDIEKSKKKKCFKEIVSVLNYLLDTDESSDKQSKNNKCSSQNSERASKIENGVSCQTKILVDKAVQLTGKKKKVIKPTESSDLPTSTDFPETSTDSTTCKVLNKIKNECEKYQNIKHCKYKKCDASSSSANYDQCKHCICRNHKCKRKYEKSKEKLKKPIAYNLIIQTSESISEETICNDKQSLKNIIVKVPSRYKKLEKEPFKEVVNKIQKKMAETNKSHRSKSVPNDGEMSSSGEIRQANTIREYLEKNRPDFVEKCSQRQNCLKYISESRANERAAHRDLLSMLVDGSSPMNVFTLVELRHLAKEIGILPSNHKQTKIIGEREMKKRSEKIYKSLPEVVQKKEDRKKENIKRTNLLMANIFKKNLQKKALRGSVNLSNYSTVIKI